MWDEIKRLIDSDVVRDRTLGWNQLQIQIMASRFLPQPDQVRWLQESMIAERDERLWRQATQTLLCLLGKTDDGKGTKHSDGPSQLSDWFWRPFRGTSAVFRGYDESQRRDEDAVIELGRYLSRQKFPEVVFVRILLDKPEWEDALAFARAVCLVGRLGIYGADALHLFDVPDSRFYFPKQQRPAELLPGDIDPEYHRIQERFDGVDVGPPFETTEENGKRVDYGIVQRYHAPKRDKIVVICAGCSSLGTLGAVLWAADLEKQGLPLPDDVLMHERTRLEALVEVQADQADFPANWNPEQPRLLRLLVDDREWFSHSAEWRPRSPDQLVIVLDAAKKPVEVRSNDGRLLAQNRSAIVQIIAAIDELAPSFPDRAVPRSNLKRHRAWRRFQQHEAQNLRRLRQQFGNAISVGDSEFQLHVPVVYEASEKPRSSR